MLMVTQTSITNDELDRLLEIFNGDPVAASRALQARADDTKKKTAARHDRQPTGPVLVRVENVKKSYKVGRQHINALNGVSLEIHEGEFIALTGTSGSGKSTLLQLIGGLDKPTDGIVEVDGVNLKTMRDSALSKFRNQTIGFVFQFFYLQPFLRVGTNLEVPGMFARTPRTLRRERAAELAQAVGVTDRMIHLPRELSGGQMQRVAIARALLNKPKLLLADEPTGNLDSVNGQAILELFEFVRAQYGTTVVVVTHDPKIAARADREVKLSDGVIV
jgi:ABC-type lipoprotein export system ATPase subunit